MSTGTVISGPLATMLATAPHNPYPDGSPGAGHWQVWKEAARASWELRQQSARLEARVEELRRRLVLREHDYAAQDELADLLARVDQLREPARRAARAASEAEQQLHRFAMRTPPPAGEGL